MDLQTVITGVIFGNFLTIAFFWQARKLNSDQPPLRHIVVMLLMIGAIGLIIVPGAAPPSRSETATR